MIKTLLSNGSVSEYLIRLLLTLPVALISLSVHELCHGYAAYKLGDPTARNMGRLTLNPLKHLDLIGVAAMVLVGFGWAKPVPVNSRYFKKPKRDMALTAAAGPLSNLLLALLGMILLKLFEAIFIDIEIQSNFLYYFLSALYQFLFLFHWLNVCLAVFNLIPIPPLDGSKIFYVFLPEKAYYAVMKYEQYIQLILLVLLFMGALTTPLSFVSGAISDLMSKLVGLVPGL